MSRAPEKRSVVEGDVLNLKPSYRPPLVFYIVMIDYSGNVVMQGKTRRENAVSRLRSPVMRALIRS